MDYELTYSLINWGVLPAWALLAIAPRWSITRRLVHSFLYPIVYGLIYAGLLASSIFFGNGAEDGGFGSLAGVMALFSHPNGVLIGWTHYLVYDLFIGAWISRDAIARNISHLFILPILFFALMFGPVGLLLYAILRLVMRSGDPKLEERAT